MFGRLIQSLFPVVSPAESAQVAAEYDRRVEEAVRLQASWAYTAVWEFVVTSLRERFDHDPATQNAFIARYRAAFITPPQDAFIAQRSTARPVDPEDVLRAVLRAYLPGVKEEWRKEEAKAAARRKEEDWFRKAMFNAYLNGQSKQTFLAKVQHIKFAGELWDEFVDMVREEAFSFIENETAPRLITQNLFHVRGSLAQLLSRFPNRFHSLVTRLWREDQERIIPTFMFNIFRCEEPDPRAALLAHFHPTEAEVVLDIAERHAGTVRMRMEQFQIEEEAMIRQHAFVWLRDGAGPLDRHLPEHPAVRARWLRKWPEIAREAMADVRIASLIAAQDRQTNAMVNFASRIEDAVWRLQRQIAVQQESAANDSVQRERERDRLLGQMRTNMWSTYVWRDNPGMAQLAQQDAMRSMVKAISR